MSRELYQARAKKVQKLGRDGLVEQDRTTGQERRVSQKAADVSFGPERPEPERTAPARHQQRTQQQRQYQQEIRQAENTSVANAWEPVRDVYQSDFPAESGVISDAPVLDGYFPDKAAPEIPDAAPSMRGAVDMPMVAPPPVTESGPTVVRLRSRKPGKEREKGPHGNSKDLYKEPDVSRRGQRQTEGGNRLKFDGERRITPEKSPERRAGDEKSPALRGAEDTPLKAQSSAGEIPRPARYRSDMGGRLQFDAERKPEEKADSRTAQKKQAARQFSADTAGTENRLHFESARPLSSGGAGTVPDGTRLRFAPDAPVLPDMPEDDEDHQTGVDAAEAVIDAAIPVVNALRRPEKPKAGRKDRQKKGRKAEKTKDCDRRENSDESVPVQQKDSLNPDAVESRDEARTSADKKPDKAENLDKAEPFTPETGRKNTPVENGGRLHFERDKKDASPVIQDVQRPASRLENQERLRFDDTREQTSLPDMRKANPAVKRRLTAQFVRGEQKQETVERTGKTEPASPSESTQRPTRRTENRERLRFDSGAESSVRSDARSGIHTTSRTPTPHRTKLAQLPPPSAEFSGSRLRFETDTSQKTTPEADSGVWNDETVSEPLYAVIDGEVVQAEVVEEPPKKDRFSGNQSRQDRTAEQGRYYDGTTGQRASRFSSDTANTASGASHADVIDVEFRIVETPEEPVQPENRKQERHSEQSEKHPPSQRMEDGAKLRFDADWNADSGSQTKQKKPETAEKKGPFRWKRNTPKPETSSPESNSAAGEHGNTTQKSDASSRLHFEEKPPKLTDESQRPRKGPRLMFGIGKNVKPADSAKSTGKGTPTAADSSAVQADQKNLSRRIGQRQEVRKSSQSGKTAPDKRTGETGNPARSDSSPRQDAPELWTRRKPAVKAAENRDGKPENGQEQKKRRRLQFEPEPRRADDPEQEGYTRKPPKPADDESRETEDAPQKKPRLRFENEPHNGEEKASEETANQRTDAPKEPLKIGDGTTQEEPQKPVTREDKQVSRAEKRVEKASRRLEKAQSKIPVKRRIKLEKQYDEASGKVRHRLQFEKEPVPEGASTMPLPLRGISGAANSARVTLLLKGHQKVHEMERQNVGVEAGHKVEIVAEQGAGSFLRWNHRRLRTKPYRAVRQAERALEREQVNLEWRRTLRDNPELRKKHALTKWVQKQKLKRKYAAAAREAKKTEQHTQNILNATGQIIRAAAQYIAAKKSVLAAVALLGLIVLLFSTGLTSCMAMLSSVQSSYISISYMADEEDICEADLYYSEMETDLQIDIDDTEVTHPGYDEYRYNLGEIGHNPFQLLSYLSTKYNAFKFRRIKSDIEALFWEQYTLTRTVVVETKYDSDGDPYDWYVLVTTLVVRPLSNLISEKLDAGEEMTRYGLYMQTCGNRQAFGNPFDFPWMGRISSLYGYRKHPMTGAKNLHRGVDIGAPEGTEIHAVQDGRVVSAREEESYGLCIVIEDDKGYSTRYAHCSRVDVHAGQRVKRGDVIAAVGSTGDSTGPHLHLETKLNGEYLNPLFFVETGGEATGVPGGGGGAMIPGYPGEPPTDETFARILAEAERYLGYPYVWGGSSPATSFDCSGYVSWVINHSGWNVGRLGAQALCNLCTPVSPENARPGDLVFFRYTYAAPIPDGVTHCGIYVGNNQMIHCGNPISYTNLTSSYWQAHFYCFGRLPTP